MLQCQVSISVEQKAKAAHGKLQRVSFKGWSFYLAILLPNRERDRVELYFSIALLLFINIGQFNRETAAATSWSQPKKPKPRCTYTLKKEGDAKQKNAYNTATTGIRIKKGCARVYVCVCLCVRACVCVYNLFFAIPKKVYSRLAATMTTTTTTRTETKQAVCVHDAIRRHFLFFSPVSVPIACVVRGKGLTRGANVM